MKLDIRGKNIEVTDALRDYTTKRLSKLEKYFDDVREAQVALSVDSEGHKVEVTIPLNGMILRGEESTDNMYSSIDLVEEKLEKQINKYRTKLYRKTRGAGFKKNMKEEIEKELKSKGGQAGALGSLLLAIEDNFGQVGGLISLSSLSPWAWAAL
jgi:putative sigma-54 modulation protein